MTLQDEDQSNLFDEAPPRLSESKQQRAELAVAVTALLREIAEALTKTTKAEAGHEQDHS